jgi:hypothetical protein
MDTAPRRRALILPVGNVRDSGNPDGDTLRFSSIPSAVPEAERLARALARFGYECELRPNLPSSELGRAVRSTIAASNPEDVLIVAVVSHGDLTSSGRLYAVGSDNRISDSASVDSWMTSVEDQPDSPTTLFLLDMSYSGTAVRSPWAERTTRAKRAWVIAASGPEELAFNTQLTRAMTTVLQRFRNGEADVDPAVEYIPITLIAREVRREIQGLERDSGGPNQQVTSTLLDISSPPPQLPFFSNPSYRAASEPERNDQRTEVPILPPSEEVLPEAASYYAGFVADTVHGEDRLGVSAEVDTLCNVIMAREVRPPLSIGLFGDWGTGKSFFMSLMRDRIHHLAAAAERLRVEGGDPEQCSGICQIEFNAWHYIDTNLWASLASRIFEQLASAEGDLGLRQAMEDLPSVRALSVEMREQHRQATAKLAELDKEISQVRPVGIGDLVSSEISKMRGWSAEQASTQINGLLEKAGVPKDKVSQLDLGEVIPQLTQASGRLFFLLKRGRWSVRAILALALVIVIGGPPIFTALLSHFVSGPTALASSIIGCVIAAGVVTGPFLSRASNLLKTAADLTASVDASRMESAKSYRELLQRKIIDVQAEIDDLDARMESFKEAWSVQSFAVKRVGEGEYRQQEGMISLFRKDLEELSRRLAPPSEEDPQHRRPPADLERIVLYIDDLDRCPPARVVEVLQAIHLLLAFPLFVVVVGADPRWLVKSLNTHYRSILGENEGTEHGDRSLEDHWAATPQNYLEKIFQIPFCLRPMDSTGYAELIRADAGLAPEEDLPGAESSAVEADSTGPRDQGSLADRPGPGADTAADEQGSPFALRAPLPIRDYGGGGTAVLAVGFPPSPGGAQPMLISVDAAGTVSLHDLRHADVITAIYSVEVTGAVAQLGADGSVIVINRELADKEYAASFYSSKTGKRTHTVAVQPGPDFSVSAVLVSPSAKRSAAVWTRDHGQPSLYSIASVTKRTTLEPTLQEIGEPQTMADAWLVVNRGGDIRWVSNSGSTHLDVEPGSRFVTDLSQERLIAVTPSGRIRVWTINNTATEISSSQDLGGYSPADVVSLGPRDLMAVAHLDTVEVWDIADAELLTRIPASSTVTALAFSADGTQVAIGTETGSVQTWLIAPPSMSDELAAGIMRLTPAEFASMLSVAALVPTPRAARRLVNIYRLLHAGLPLEDLERLRAGDHAVVMLMLAMLMGFPQLSTELLEELIWHPDSPPDTFSGLLLSHMMPVSEAESSNASAYLSQIAWNHFGETVGRILDKQQTNDQIDAYHYWAPYVALFSFRTIHLLSARGLRQ